MILSSIVRNFSSCSGRGAVYEVSIKFNDVSISSAYISWLNAEHVKEVLKFPGFVSAEIMHAYPKTSHEIVVKYQLESPSVFDEYNKSETALKLRLDAISKFGNDSFSASRRVLLNGDIVFAGN